MADKIFQQFDLNSDIVSKLVAELNKKAEEEPTEPRISLVDAARIVRQGI